MKNGAHGLIETLIKSGVEVCFANPGTSEMQLVQAIDQIPGMRPILALFEGVVTGAADGYARMARKPACTLLHLGPGLANGVANLHNAKKAHSPVVNVVGDHALHHVKFDAPLTADVEGIARPVSHWVRSAQSPSELAELGAEAVAIAGHVPGQVATVIAPADNAWTELPNNFVAPSKRPVAALPSVPARTIGNAVKALKRARKPVLLLGGEALQGEGLIQAGRIAAVLPVRLHAETFNRRVERGAGRVPVDIVPYFGDRVLELFASVDVMVLLGSKRPVAFFAYPNKPSVLVPDSCEVLPVAGPTDDVVAALTALADALNAPAAPKIFQAAVDLPEVDGPLNAQLSAHVIGRCLPEGAIVIDEGITSSAFCQQATLGSPAHDWIQLMGGAIGNGLPLAVGAAVACPDRKVICLEGDGSAMYTVQSLWTMAREKLDVINVIFANRSYAILNIEFERVGVGAPGPRALSMLDMSGPSLAWTELGRGMGVNSARVDTARQFETVFRGMLRTKGPHLIEVVLPPKPF